MDDANRVSAELDCPRCGQRARMEVRFRYGPAGHRALALGDRIEWTPGAARLDDPSTEPDLEVPVIASCPACAKLAAHFARAQWRALRRACEPRETRDGTPVAHKVRALDERIETLLAFFDYGFALREARELGGEVIARPGRYIERLGELVLGYSPVLFDRMLGALRLERDRLVAVRLLPLAVQDALRAFPVTIHFGALSAAVPALFAPLARRGEGWLVPMLYRLAMRAEIEGWRETLASAEEGRLELAAKLASLLAHLPWTDASLAPLAALDRFSSEAEVDDALAEAFGGLPEWRRDEPAAQALRRASVADPA
ncbi:MAG: hypothetical protein U0610_20065 [bacterium]